MQLPITSVSLVFLTQTPVSFAAIQGSLPGIPRSVRPGRALLAPAGGASHPKDASPVALSLRILLYKMLTIGSLSRDKRNLLSPQSRNVMTTMASSILHLETTPGSCNVPRTTTETYCLRQIQPISATVLAPASITIGPIRQEPAWE